MNNRKAAFRLFILFLFMLIIFIFHMFYGVDIFNGLFSDIDKTILTQIRLPRGFLGILAGGGLSVCGAALQGVFRNNLVEPYTLGVSGGAAVGVALAISLSLNMLLGYFTLILAGFLGAVFVLFLLYYIAIKENRFDIKTLLLIGVMISFMSSSILMLILSVSKTENLHGIIFWMMGSLSDAENMINIWLGIIVLSGLFVFYLMANDLNAIQFGYEKSFTLGVNVENVIRMTVLISSLVTASIVSVTGVIGFVGLVVPHVMRKFFYNDFRILFLASFLGGGAFLLLSDMIASKIIYPIELPVGVVTGILGGALFINIFRKERVKWK